MRTTNIVFLGVGSLYFGLSILKDIFAAPELAGTRLSLVDIDEENLGLMTSLALRMNEAAGADIIVRQSTERRDVLDGADFVISAVAANRAELWKKDFALPFKYGMRHTYGESAGVGGLSFTLRNVTLAMEILRDMERQCPGATLINFSNPEARIVLAANIYTNIRAIGFCHGVDMARKRMAHIMGRQTEEVDVWAAGLNHLQWVTHITDAVSGEDLYPAFRESIKPFNPGDDEEGRYFLKYLYQKFGLFPTTDDKHVGEYFAYGWQKAGTEGHDFDADEEMKLSTRRDIEAWVRGDRDVAEIVGQRSGERAIDLIRASVTNAKTFLAAVNVANNGSILNLPPEVIVEVPAMADATGVRPICMGELPEPVAAILRLQSTISRTAVDATILGSRELALQALLVDPLIDNADAAESCLEEILELNRPYIPQFYGGQQLTDDGT